jgi:hypothetical protein
VDGWLSFYWGATIEENQAKGDLAGAIMAQWLKYWREHRESSPSRRDSSL